MATILKARPDLAVELPSLEVEVQPIPEAMPTQFAEKHSSTVPDIGQPVTACFFTLSNIDPTNWWVFEKFDGVRGFWNPGKKTFFSRKGNKLNVPQHVIDDMPDDMFLDGELW